MRALGTADYLADANLPRSIGGRTRENLADPETVYGELITLDDPEERLSKIDGLEGFRPGEEGFYTRVLIPVTLTRGGETVPAWAYSTDEGSGVHLPGGAWPV